VRVRAVTPKTGPAVAPAGVKVMVGREVNDPPAVTPTPATPTSGVPVAVPLNVTLGNDVYDPAAVMLTALTPMDDVAVAAVVEPLVVKPTLATPV
jgi:hypothetical protein